MTGSADHVLESFSNQRIARMQGELSCKLIKQEEKLIIEKSVETHSNLGSGDLGHAGMVVNPENV